MLRQGNPALRRLDDEDSEQETLRRKIDAASRSSQDVTSHSAPEITTGTMTFLRIIVLTILLLISYLIGSGTNGIAAIFAGVFFIVTPILYFLPTIEAALRKHPSMVSIGLINLFLGWTLLGWVVAIAWACKGVEKVAFEPEVKNPMPSAPPKEHFFQPSAATPSVADEIIKLVALRDKGILTEEEFVVQKAKLLA